FERRLFVDILRVGLPMSLQPILVNVTLAVLTGFVGLLGVDALAGFGVAVRLEYVVYPVSFGFSAGMLAMVATNIGARRLARARRAQRVDGGGTRGRHHRRNRAVRAGVADRLGGAVQRGARGPA